MLLALSFNDKQSVTHSLFVRQQANSMSKPVTRNKSVCWGKTW